VKLVDMVTPASVEEFEDVYLVMEYMQSDLHKIIYSDNALSNGHIAFVVFQILCGLKYMHSANIIHRDLKPGNILVNSDCSAKICDFGLARGFEEEDEDQCFTEYVVTRWYRAPEVVVSARRYDKSVDVWALGCIMAEMYLKRPIFQGEDYIDQLRVIFKLIGTPDEDDMVSVMSEDAVNFIHRLKKREKKNFADVFERASPDAIDLLEKFLIFDPAKRITVDEALNHPFLEKYFSQEVVDASIHSQPQMDMSFEDIVFTKETLQDAMFDEIKHFRPTSQDLVRTVSPPVRKSRNFLGF